jgi:hypothetical protein
MVELLVELLSHNSEQFENWEFSHHRFWQDWAAIRW